jgi:hypothetical protein
MISDSPYQTEDLVLSVRAGAMAGGAASLVMLALSVVARSLRAEPYLVDLWNTEDRAHGRALAFFERAGISTIDVLPALQGVIASGVNPYPSDSNGHPVKAGYEAIARAVAQRLMSAGLGRR